MRTPLGRLGLATSTLVLTAGLLAGCGSSDSSADPSEVTASADPSTATPPSGGPDAMMDAGQLAKIRACLKAAGLDDELPSGPPSGMPSEPPSDLPTDRPSGMPTDAPSDLPSDMAGGGPGAFLSDEAQQALAACGIELPSPPDNPAG